MGGTTTEERLAREREWHDDRFGADEGRPLGRIYAINAAGEQFFQDAIDALPPDAKVLDYGCGDGAYCALHAAQRGLDATAIDISPVAVENARRTAEEHGVAERISFAAMNAEELTYSEDSFDAVAGLGVIHHLDVDAGMAEIARVLKPGGKAYFMEAMGHNPAINLFRRMTPDQRTEDEHPLRIEDFDTMRNHFGGVEIGYLHLLNLLSIPLIGRRGFDGAVARLGTADQALFRRFKPARKYAWISCITLSDPR